MEETRTRINELNTHINTIKDEVDSIRRRIDTFRSELPEVSLLEMNTDDLSVLLFRLNYYGRSGYSVHGYHKNNQMKFTINGIKYDRLSITFEYDKQSQYLRHYCKFERVEADSKGDRHASPKAREIMHDLVGLYETKVYRFFEPQFETAKLLAMSKGYAVAMTIDGELMEYLTKNV